VPPTEVIGERIGINFQMKYLECGLDSASYLMKITLTTGLCMPKSDK
jgi:hypothetical protein